MTAAEIADAVAAFHSRHLVCTGGEPLLQLDSDLLRLLKLKGFYVQIRNQRLAAGAPRGRLGHVLAHEAALRHRPRRRNQDSIPGQDPELTAALFDCPRRFLQPCSGQNTAETVAYILRHPQWRLSLQTHKLIDIR